MTGRAYSHPTIALHWLLAVLLVAGVAMGTWMTELDLSPDKLKFYAWHKWLGVTIFGLVVLRILWRVTHPAPPYRDPMPAWQHRVSSLVHLALYALMIAIPLSGWLMSSAKGYQTVYFGIWPIPDLLGKDKELGDLLGEVHELLNDALILLVVLHVGAALKHHLIDRDGVMARMAPWIDKS